MLIEYRRNAVLCGFRSSDAFAFGFCVLHAASDSVADHAKFQLCEDAAHLDEGLAHGINVAVSAINRDTADDNQPELLSLDDLHDLAKLLRGSGEAADFQRDNRVALLGRV